MGPSFNNLVPGVVIFQAHSHWPSSKLPNLGEASYPSAGSQAGFRQRSSLQAYRQRLHMHPYPLRDFQRADFLVCSAFHLLLGWSGKHPNFLTCATSRRCYIFMAESGQGKKNVWNLLEGVQMTLLWDLFLTFPHFLC